ncbi:MAG: RHS repeat domain-containing protein, partial [Pyrinomonadaceae bacterium]
IIGQYYFDGDGKRVKKVTASKTRVFVYNAGGKLVSEYSTLTPNGNPVTRYLTSDHLGSPRVLTDQSGSVQSRRDFLPFGEEAMIGTGPRQVGQGYTYGDSIRQKFTGYQRDEESNLDFAQARMYSNHLGRFSAADPLLSSGRTGFPSSWNRYVYAINNPLRFIDPLGLYEFDPSQSWTVEEKEAFRKNLKAARKNLKKIGKEYGKNSEEYKEVEKALATYGCESGKGKCTDNNLVISKDATLQGEARATRIDNDTRVKVTFDAVSFTLNQENTIFASGITHEGVHASDHMNYINSNKEIKPTDYDSERRAYVAESAMGQIMQIDVQGRENSYTPVRINGINYPLFDPSWRISNENVSQTESIRIERNKSIDSLLAVPRPAGYGLTPSAPGNSYFP